MYYFCFFSCLVIEFFYGKCYNNGIVIEGMDILERLNVIRFVGENIVVFFCFIFIFRILIYFFLCYLYKLK